MELLNKLLSTPFDFLRDYGGPFILVLSVLVFVHEWGHYIVARLCGVRVDSFSIGFGKEIFGHTDKNGTRWKFSLIPLGGYVQMFGDVDPASTHHAEGVKEGEKVRPFTAEERKVAFYAQPVASRAAIVAAGPVINYLFAIFILTGLYVFEGQPYAPPVAAKVIENYPAASAGFKPDDRVISMNGVKIHRFQDIGSMVMINLDEELTVEVASYLGDGKWSDQTHTLKVTPKRIVETDRFGFKHETAKIGIAGPDSQTDIKQHNIGSAVVAAVVEVYEITKNTLKALGQMIMGFRSTDELGGILRIGAYAGHFAQAGFIALITFAALLSVNLGFINLLPIPMLDGGHLAFYAMETLRGKPLGEHIQEYFLRAGMALLASIMLFATWNDLVQLKVVDYVKNLIS